MKKEENKKDRWHWQFVRLLRPMIYMAIFSVIYSFVYMWLSGSNLNANLIRILGMLWLSLFGVGGYFVCTLIWGKKHGTLSLFKSVVIYVYNLLWVCLIHLFSWGYQQMWAMSVPSMAFLPLQLAAGFLLIALIPVTILFYRQMYEGTEDYKEILHNIWNIIRQNPAGIFNFWLLVFFMMAIWDTLFSGPLTFYFGFNAVGLLSNLAYLSSPFFYPVMMGVISSGAGGFMYLILLYVLFGLLCCVIWGNLISYLGSFTARPASKAVSAKTK